MSVKNLSTLEIYKFLNKSNCGDCHAKTCFAFASLVNQGQKRLEECPHLPEAVQQKLITSKKPPEQAVEEQPTILAELRNKVSMLKFHEIAPKLLANIEEGRLVIPVMGKNFFLAPDGGLTSEIHVHIWIQVPLLNYVLMVSDKKPSGEWVSFRELPSGERWYPLYRQRTEKALLKLANENEALFTQVLTLFGRKKECPGVEADVSFLLYPLPKMPFLVTYSRPEEGFESNLSICYERLAEDILDIGSIYSLASGISIMFEKIMKNHKT